MSGTAEGPSHSPGDHDLLENQVQAINRFPDQNPNPVMRVSDDGHLTYANPACRLVCEAIGAGVGDVLAPDIWDRLRSAGAQAGAVVEVTAQHRTFALLPVPVPELGFMNVYGTDVTAQQVIAKFPNQNPNPVLRMERDGTLRYANEASKPIVDGLGLKVGGRLSTDLERSIFGALGNGSTKPVEVTVGELTFELLPVLVQEFDFINLYGTDVTAVRELAKSKMETERLLLNILPPPIADRLRSGERVIADRFDNSTLLIADIVGFTKMSSQMAPDQVVQMLDDVFSMCDELVDRHGLEKIKTIGDAYMVVGGVPIETPDHARRVAEFALDMIDGVNDVQRDWAHPVSVRVGMSSGPVVAGVIGNKRTTYDVWGDTVNLASRMESLGVPGRIQVARPVHDLLSKHYLLEPRGKVEVKGKGRLPTWFLVGRR